MSGESKQTQTQQSTTNPYAPAEPMLKGILGQLQGQLGNTGLTGNENNALNQLTANAGTANQFAPAIKDYALSMLQGGGANAQAGNIQGGFNKYFDQINPLASNTNYDPRNTPGFGDSIDALKADITQGVNGQFAAAGRDFSGMNAQTLGRGLMQGLAPIYQSQFNANREAQTGAARDLLNAGTSNYGILSGLQQQFLQNQGAGVDASGKALDAQNNAPNAVLAAEAQRRGIPLQQLGLLANIGVPIAGLGSQSSGTSTATHSPSMLSQIGQGVGIASNLFGGGQSGTLPAMFKFISDRNAKTDIEQVGMLFDGTPVYRYRYKWERAFQIGLMAQDVEKYAPEAVGMIGEYKAVDYKLATDKALEVA